MRARRPLLAILAVAAAAAAVARPVLAAEAPQFVPREAYDRPDRLARLPDGRQLNFRCLGVGSPTVILESGFGVGAYAWGRVAPRIAAVTRVCAYDRAGYGFSDSGPLPRDGQAIARDLDRGLKAAELGGPYVLVGHSAGGLYARLFAARRRRAVVGIVFVDSSVEHQTQRAAAAYGTRVDGLDGQIRRAQRCGELAENKGSAAIEPERATCAVLAGPGPRGIADRPATWRTQVSELETLFAATSDQVERTRNVLAGVPVIVLTAARQDGPPGAQTDPTTLPWQYMHQELAARFGKNDHRLVKSSHLMMNDRPEVVAGAAIELVEAARKH